MANAELFAIGASAGAFPPNPDDSVTPFLEAATRCIERFGFRRTSVADVAKEAGVERTTVYRRVGSMDDIFRLLIARELHLLMAAVPARAALGADGVDLVVEIVAFSIEHARAHPVLAKVLADEPDVVAGFVSAGLGELFTRVTDTLAPVVSVAMSGGLIAPRDPVLVTDWVTRFALTLLVVPPPIPLRDYLRAVFEPVLRDTRSS